MKKIIIINYIYYLFEGSGRSYLETYDAGTGVAFPIPHSGDKKEA